MELLNHSGKMIDSLFNLGQHQISTKNLMELINRKRVKCLKCYKYDYFTQICPVAIVVPTNTSSTNTSSTNTSSIMASLFGNLGGPVTDVKPYIPFNLQQQQLVLQQIATVAAIVSTVLIASSLPQPLSRIQWRRRNKASKPLLSTPQPPPPPAPQPAIFPADYLADYLEHWMNQYNPLLAHAPFPPRQRAVSDNNFNYNGDMERWVREREWGLSAPLA